MRARQEWRRSCEHSQQTWDCFFCFASCLISSQGPLRRCRTAPPGGLAPLSRSPRPDSASPGLKPGESQNFTPPKDKPRRAATPPASRAACSRDYSHYSPSVSSTQARSATARQLTNKRPVLGGRQPPGTAPPRTEPAPAAAPLRWSGSDGTAETLSSPPAPVRATEGKQRVPSGPTHGPRERWAAGTRAAPPPLRRVRGQPAASRGGACAGARRARGASSFSGAHGCPRRGPRVVSSGIPRAAGGSHRAAPREGGAPALPPRRSRRWSFTSQPEWFTQPSAAAGGSSGSHCLRRRADAKA